MKKFLSIVTVLGLVFSLYAKDTYVKVSLWERSELDKVEVVNCTRNSDIRGIIVSGKQSVGFVLKETGDKYTCFVGDWKRSSPSYCVLFDTEGLDLTVLAHTDDEDCYFSVIEKSSVKSDADFLQFSKE